MDFTTGQYVQLIGALAAGVALFIAVYRVPEKATLAFLVILIPFQLVDSRYGTLNTVLIYLVVFAYLLQGRMRAAPMFWPSILVLFAYAISFSMVHPAARTYNLFWLVGFFSGFLLFYLVVNFVQRSGDWRFLIKTLHFTNVLVVIACVLEMTVGQSQTAVFGIKEWTIDAGRAHAGRLVGPFGSTHTTADYLVIQCVLLGFCLINESRSRVKFLFGSLLAANSMLLVATGDRGGFVSFVLAALSFLFLFRREIGSFRAVRMLVAGVVLFSISSFLMVQYTDFGVLYSRLEETEFAEGGVPDNRATSVARGVQYFSESPIVGLGPVYTISGREPDEKVADIPWRNYPHNLPLHILASTGIVGMIAWTIFLLALTISLLSMRRVHTPDAPLSQMPRVGLLVLFVFLVGEMRVEFLRVSMEDVQHYMFVLFGLFVACAALLEQQARVTRPAFAAWQRPATVSYNRDAFEGRPRRS